MDHYGRNFRAPKVDVHKFAMIPRAEIPRSKFKMQSNHKTTIGASSLYPVFIQEILPGDTLSLKMTAFCRMATPIYPIMDNLDLESWFFFVPNRLVWTMNPSSPGGWVQFMGEQTSTPSDSISYTIPQIVSPVAGFVAFSVYDYFGIPGVGQIGGAATVTINALPLRAYNKIWNEWFRDENLENAVGYGAANTVYDLGPGPDPYTNYTVLPLNKRHDYFTSCLPWTQKGAAGAVTLPLGTSATVRTATTQLNNPGSATSVMWFEASNTATGVPANLAIGTGASINLGDFGTTAIAAATGHGYVPGNLYADLSTATAATINSIRLAFQTQKLLERDARGGTRYTEIVRSHFGVTSPDARLQRPEYLGGGKTPVNIAPVPQTSATGLTGGTTPTGNLAAVGTVVAHGNGFHQSFTEHGHVIGLVGVRGDCTYQQGLRRLWTRQTRYDFYWPVFAMLGEQAVRNDEIYCVGTTAGTDTAAFGFQERWAELRYFPSMVSGAFRSTYATPLDAWHLAQKFTALPALNQAFLIEPSSAVLTRNLAGGAAVNNEQFLCDLFFDMTAARPLPMYSVPGLIDHF